MLFKGSLNKINSKIDAVEDRQYTQIAHILLQNALQLQSYTEENIFPSDFLSEQSIKTLLGKGNIFERFHCIKSVVLKEWICVV